MATRTGRPAAPPPALPLEPVSMEAAVGYPTIACTHEKAVEHALVLKHARLFLVTTAHGDVDPPGACSLGLFQDDTRILSRYALHVEGGPPALLSGQVPRTFAGEIDLAVKDIPFGGDPWDPKNAIHVRRQQLLCDRFIERLTLTNYLRTGLDYRVALDLGADFADIFEVRGWKREARGEFYAPVAERDRLVFGYRGRDGALLRSVVRFREPPHELGPEGARWRFPLAPSCGRFVVEWEVHTEEEPRPVVVPGATLDAPSVVVGDAFEQRRDAMERAYAGWRSGCTRWHSDVEDFDAVLARAVDDLRALYVEVDGERVVSAGIPWYSTIFGRDSILTSLQTLPLAPRIAVDTLRYLARRQGTKEDPYTEEQPGKILHELRRGEMARSGEIPHVPYYGTIDATPLFCILLHETWRWTGDDALVRALLPNAQRALEWCDRFGDMDGDGFVEYARTSAKGLVNQGWKDSGDGVPWPDGTLPEPPIALVEVQGYVYDAKVRMSELCRVFGLPAEAERLRAEAARLRARIERHFWLDDLGTFALALDGAKRPLPTVTSNAGHLLWSRVPTPAQAARMTDQLLGPDMFSGWGIRTLSARHPAYNPMSYHDGSVWPHDNAIIVLGLAHNGFAERAHPVVRGLHEAAARDEAQRLPELFCGIPRGYATRPVAYPVSCSPQAWASGAMFMMLQAMLGLFPEAPARVLHVRNPVLPDFLCELTVADLQVGGSRVALQFRRHQDRTLCNLLGISGAPLQVRIELS
ncbi:MAG TPA: glycogen debranching N-terminal domain-containing protein [Gemmatimonadales bacterium]|nr:glycogen debranching N-terminal domain-containing protein [Gemmatimonadales bacterium]